MFYIYDAMTYSYIYVPAFMLIYSYYFILLLLFLEFIFIFAHAFSVFISSPYSSSSSRLYVFSSIPCCLISYYIILLPSCSFIFFLLTTHSKAARHAVRHAMYDGAYLYKRKSKKMYRCKKMHVRKRKIKENEYMQSCFMMMRYMFKMLVFPERVLSFCRFVILFFMLEQDFMPCFMFIFHIRFLRDISPARSTRCTPCTYAISCFRKACSKIFRAFICLYKREMFPERKERRHRPPSGSPPGHSPARLPPHSHAGQGAVPAVKRG